MASQYEIIVANPCGGKVTVHQNSSNPNIYTGSSADYEYAVLIKGSAEWSVTIYAFTNPCSQSIMQFLQDPSNLSDPTGDYSWNDGGVPDLGLGAATVV